MLKATMSEMKTKNKNNLMHYNLNLNTKT